MVNAALALVVILAAVAIYWLAVRPLPQTSGRLTAPIHAKGFIRRDGRGNPHIEASSWQDALFLQGYATAQDRLWQMDSLRRFAAGELAEVFGPGALAVDQRSRRMRMRALAEADLLRLRPIDREAFSQYARGVNYYIDTHRGNYSLEFSLPGHAYDPRSWSLTDSMLIGLVMFRDLTDNSEYEWSKSVLLSRAGAVPDGPARIQFLFPSPEGQALSPGSNAWAISGAHTVTGKPMLANDMHLSYGVPSTWHLVHLKTPEFEVAGTALPGVPFVITGHNRQIAWGVTNLGTDVMDLYAEQLDERTGRYQFAGHLEQAQLDRQFIGVRDSKPVPMNIWVTRHGPVVLTDKGRSYTMRWAAADGFGFPFLDLARAQDWNSFRQAVSIFWGPGQNFVYADGVGNIGYQAAGRIPIRGDGSQAFATDTPLDGAAGNAEWTGYVPFEKMPSVLNPPSGIIATANQNPYPPDFPFPAPGRYDDAYRVNQIRSRLLARNKLQVSDLQAIQKDVYSAYDLFLARQIMRLATHKDADNSVREAAQVLKGWNGQMDGNLAAPLICELFSNELRSGLVDASVAANDPEKPAILPRPSRIQQLLRTRPPGWVEGNDWDRMLLRNLTRALASGRKEQGSPIAKWKWGQFLQWNFEHPVGKQLPLVSEFFDIGPVPMSGSGTTVKQTTRTLGPSERLVVDFSKFDNSTLSIPVGESGMVASKHYKDQWPAYYVGKSFPMEWNKVSAAEVLEVQPGK